MTLIFELVITALLIIAILLLILTLKKVNSQEAGSTGEEFAKQFSLYYDKTEKLTKDEFGRNREEMLRTGKEQREEISRSIKLLGEQLSDRMAEISRMQKNQLDVFADQLNKLTQTNEQKFESLRDKVSEHLKDIQESNSKKLEEMRVTVDEKLHSTLEKRLGESFKLVSERLELVHKGLGEMQNLASGVGDLKRVLTNVKSRGAWGEIQLGNLIEQILTPDQYEKNVVTKTGSRESVEYAIKLPGRDPGKENVVWLPIDAKFPLEDYQRLLDAQDSANAVLVEDASKSIDRRIKDESKKISEKYLNPPNTTDFAIMFLPIEGLYAEVVRRPGLADFIQREHRVILAGPMNLAALLNSLQMGFRTLAIEKRSSEVWKLLAAVKTEFGKFGDILDKTQEKLDQASKTIGEASKKTRTIQRKLRSVEELPSGEEQNLLDEASE